jgi:hypothetical protein
MAWPSMIFANHNLKLEYENLNLTMAKLQRKLAEINFKYVYIKQAFKLTSRLSLKRGSR